MGKDLKMGRVWFIGGTTGNSLWLWGVECEEGSER